MTSENEGTIESLNEALRIDPNNAALYQQRSDIYLSSQEFQYAIDDLDEVIRLNPDSSDAYHSRGAAYTFLGQFQRAVEDYNEAIRLNPTEGLTYYARAEAYHNLEQYSRVIEDCSEAIGLGVDLVATYNRRGMAYEALGQNDLAKQDFQVVTRASQTTAIDRYGGMFIYMGFVGLMSALHAAFWAWVVGEQVARVAVWFGLMGTGLTVFISGFDIRKVPPKLNPQGKLVPHFLLSLLVVALLFWLLVISVPIGIFFRSQIMEWYWATPWLIDFVKEVSAQ